MPRLVIANWKMNPQSAWEAMRLARQSDCEGLVIAPPFPFLEAVSKTLKRAVLGAQDMFWESPPSGKGAYTGEVSPEELKSFGVKYVITGHSERRRLGETDEMIAKKVKAALEHDLVPILCVGESAEERSAGKKEEVVRRELEAGLSLIHDSRFMNHELVIAYEPLWAIGSGAPDTPEDMAAMAEVIRKTLVASGYTLVARVLYGGSVTSENAESFLGREEINGVLVGGASLNAEEIKKIAAIAAKF